MQKPPDNDRQRRGTAFRRAPPLAILALLSACTSVGPDYERPESPLGPDWYQAEVDGFTATPARDALWWRVFSDPDLERLIRMAHAANNNLEIAALRVLEARAQFGIASGAQYPQTQVAAGGASSIGASKNAANTAAGDLRFTQYDLGITASWEIDFWGRYRRGIEAADAAYLGSVSAYDQALVLVTAQVALAYLAIRTIEEELAITRENIKSQQRSYDIVDVQYRNGNTSELDVLQARTLLLSTEAALPALEAQLAQAKHALLALLGSPPGSADDLLSTPGSIPRVPDEIAIGLPADMLRQRPDVRVAEYVAMAQNASVGLATASLYPSFTLSGSLGLVAADDTETTRTGNSGIGELFKSDSLTWSAGPGFVWPFFNYGRIRNNIRVQDARLQQALTAYRETVIQAAREVEDAVVALDGARRQDRILEQTVAVARRATDVASLRFKEGFADYQRVLDAQTALFAQQGRLVTSKSNKVAALISLYVALGGGWQLRENEPLIRPATADALRQRTDWADLIDDVDQASSQLPADEN